MARWQGPQADAFPWATLTVNVLGCTAMGLLAGWLAQGEGANEHWRLLLGVGLLGGFTTFSSFGLEMIDLIERGQPLVAMTYAGAIDNGGAGGAVSRPGRHAGTGMTKTETDASDQVRQFTVRADDNDIRVDRWFKRNLAQIGFATVSRWARTGQLRVDGARVKVDDRLATGQILRVPPGGDSPDQGGRVRRELTADQIAEADAMLIEQDRAAIVLNKPAGLATQGGTGTHHHVDLLLDAFANVSGDGKRIRPRLVHRLDKDTSGVLLVGRTPGSAAFFAKQFAGREAKKIYWALIVGVPDLAEGTVDAPICKQPGSHGEKMHVDAENGQFAKTNYRVVERAGNRCSWVELEPLTGRTHQLRVHMAAIGHPIVGDGKYGGQDAFLTGSISRKMHLHARRLIVHHPDGDMLDVTANLPEHFASSMAQIGFDPSASNAEPLTKPRPAPTKIEKKQAARQHAKQIRKERRGERRDDRSDGRRGHAGTGGRDRAIGRPKKSGGVKKGKGSPVSAKRTPAAKTSGKSTRSKIGHRKPAGGKTGNRR